jgi:hypothetical protein
MKKLICILLSLVFVFAETSQWNPGTGGFGYGRLVLPIYHPTFIVSETTMALDSAYVYGSSGDAFYFSFLCPESANLTDIWVKVSSYTGTWTATDDAINVEIREGIQGNGIPGTNLVGSTTITLDGISTGWTNKTGLSIALTAGRHYSIVVSDADGGASNFVTLFSAYEAITSPGVMPKTIRTTTSGFSSAGTSTTTGACVVFKVGSTLYSNMSGFSTIATITTGTYERGIRFKVPENCIFVGWAGANDQGTLFFAGSHVLKLYADATAPGGTTLASFTTVSTLLGGGNPPALDFLLLPAANHVKLTKDTWYRATFDPASNTTVPRKATIGGGPDATLRTILLPFNGNAYWTEESGGSWDDAQTNSFALFGPILVPNTDSAGGGSFTFVQ